MNINCKEKGLAQVPLLIILLIMAVAVPLVTMLVQQSTDNRSHAAPQESQTAQNPFADIKTTKNFTEEQPVALLPVSGGLTSTGLTASGTSAGGAKTTTSTGGKVTYTYVGNVAIGSDGSRTVYTATGSYVDNSPNHTTTVADEIARQIKPVSQGGAGATKTEVYGTTSSGKVETYTATSTIPAAYGGKTNTTVATVTTPVLVGNTPYTQAELDKSGGVAVCDKTTGACTVTFKNADDSVNQIVTYYSDRTETIALGVKTIVQKNGIITRLEQDDNKNWVVTEKSLVNADGSQVTTNLKTGNVVQTDANGIVKLITYSNGSVEEYVRTADTNTVVTTNKNGQKTREVVSFENANSNQINSIVTTRPDGSTVTEMIKRDSNGKIIGATIVTRDSHGTVAGQVTQNGSDLEIATGCGTGKVFSGGNCVSQATYNSQAEVKMAGAAKTLVDAGVNVVTAEVKTGIRVVAGTLLNNAFGFMNIFGLPVSNVVSSVVPIPPVDDVLNAITAQVDSLGYDFSKLTNTQIDNVQKVVTDTARTALRNNGYGDVADLVSTTLGNASRNVISVGAPVVAGLTTSILTGNPLIGLAANQAVVSALSTDQGKDFTNTIYNTTKASTDRLATDLAAGKGLTSSCVQCMTGAVATGGAAGGAVGAVACSNSCGGTSRLTSPEIATALTNPCNSSTCNAALAQASPTTVVASNPGTTGETSESCAKLGKSYDGHGSCGGALPTTVIVNNLPSPTSAPSKPGPGTDTCNGTAPAETCSASQINVRPICLGTTWTLTNRACTTALKTQRDVCGGTDYCCNGTAWSTDMTACSTNTTPYLNAILAYAGVQTGSMCSSNWPVAVTARAADGTTKTYTNVVPVPQTTTSGLRKYMISLALNGFTATKDVSVFIKGIKHLQVKYGIDKQTTMYNQAGGTLTLTSNPDTSPIYDFSGYPLLAGDINQDGVVDGLDFSLVKTASITRKHVVDGGYMAEDLNGNCQMESQDVTLLMLALNEKQGQLY